MVKTLARNGDDEEYNADEAVAQYRRRYRHAFSRATGMVNLNARGVHVVTSPMTSGASLVSSPLVSMASAMRALASK